MNQSIKVIRCLVILISLMIFVNQKAFTQELIKTKTIPSYYYLGKNLKLNVKYLMYDSTKVEKRTYYNGKLFELITFKYDKDSLIRHGKTIENDTAGRMMSKSNYENGKINGPVFQYYWISGQIRGVKIYDNGVLDGKFFNFYSNGNVKIEGQLEEGLKTGIWKYYYKNGYLQAIGKFAKTNNKAWKRDSIPFKFFSDTCQTSNFTPHDLKYKSIEPQLKKGLWRFYDCKGKMIGKHNYREYNE